MDGADDCRGDVASPCEGGAQDGVDRGNQQLSRSAIVAWANGLFGSSYATFAEIPSKMIALLLNSMLGDVVCPIVEIQFNDEAPTTELRNAMKVLELCKRCGFGGAKAVPPEEAVARSSVDRVAGASRKRARGEGYEPDDGVLSTEDIMDPVAWLEGKEFVKELKLWRWIRRVSFAHPPKPGYDFSLPLMPHIHTTTEAPTKRDTEKAGDAWRQSPPRHTEATRGATESLPEGLCDAFARATRQRVILQEVKEELQRHLHAANEGADMATTVATLPALPGSKGWASVAAKMEMIATINAGEASPRAAATAMASSTPACATCPEAVADVIARNVEATWALEAIRKRAIDACVRKNASDLLGALSAIRGPA